MLNALAFVPPSNVVQSFEKLLEFEFYTWNENILTPLLGFFEDTWIGRVGRNHKKRRNPKFLIDMWNCYDLVQSDLPKNNTFVEGWHNSFNSILNAIHPSIWKFIDVIKKKDEKLNKLKIEQIIAGR